MNFHIISFTEAGFSLSERIQRLLRTEYEEISVASASSRHQNNVSLSEWTKIHFQRGNCLVFVGSAGIAVRAIAPFVSDKRTDSAVLVLDEKGKFVIPILSGHIGGANECARKVACVLGATAVITAASDVNNLPAIDEFATKSNLALNDMSRAKEFASCILRGEKPHFSLSVYIKNDMLNLIPKSVVLGIGCRKGKSAAELEQFVRETLTNHKVDCRSLKKIASIDLKKDEVAILSLADALSLPFVTFSAAELNSISQGVTHSDFVSEITGTDNVCERAVFAAGAEKILIPKTARNGMTIAAGIEPIPCDIPNELQEYIQ